MDNGSCTGNWFISGKNSKENANFLKLWGQGRWHTVQTGIGDGAIKKAGLLLFFPLSYF